VSWPDDATLEDVGVEPDGGVLAAADAGSPEPASRALSRKAYLDGILGRNIFDHGAIGKESEGGGPIDPNLNVRLLGTLVAEPAELSSALIVEEGREGMAMVYSIGDKLLDAKVIAIEPRRVKLERGDGSTHWLTMEDKVEGGGPEVAAAVPPPEGEEGITELGENRYAIERSLIDKYLGDMDALSRMARAIPHRGSDGEIDGYRLSGIRRSSPLSQLGIRNGDVIHAVNGSPLTSMPDAMNAYQSLQSQSSFNFDVTRRGQRQTMEYQVR
jgi:type II secretion system protein C